jgi:hypothetical protein
VAGAVFGRNWVSVDARNVALGGDGGVAWRGVQAGGVGRRSAGVFVLLQTVRLRPS